MADYTILIKTMLDEPGLQAQIDSFAAKSKPITVKINTEGTAVNPVDQVAATASVEAVTAQLRNMAAEKINPIDEIDAEAALSAIDAKIAEIKAANAGTPVNANIVGINGAGEATGNVSATLQYKDAIGKVVSATYDWDVETNTLIESTGRLRLSQVQLTNQMDAYIATAEKAIASTSGKNQNDPTVVALQEKANSLKELATQEKTMMETTAGVSSPETLNQLKELKSGTDQASAAFGAANNNVKSFGDMIENDVTKVAQWLIATTLIYGSLREIGQGIQYVEDLNKELVNIQMITNSDQEYVAGLASEYNDLATELGSTTIAVAQSAEVWLRQGKSLEDTNKLLTASIELSKMAGISAEEASTYLTAIINGFKLSADQITSVLDKLVVLANSSSTTASVSMAQLSEALQRSSNSAVVAGVSFNQLLSYIATIETTTQKDAASIGQSLDTVFARFQSVKAGVTIDESTGESLNNVEKSLKTLGIEIRNQTDGSFKPFGDVIDELSKQWDGLNNAEKSEVAGALAGVRQRENFLAKLIPEHIAIYGNSWF